MFLESIQWQCAHLDQLSDGHKASLTLPEEKGNIHYYFMNRPFACMMKLLASFQSIQWQLPPQLSVLASQSSVASHAGPDVRVEMLTIS